MAQAIQLLKSCSIVNGSSFLFLPWHGNMPNSPFGNSSYISIHSLIFGSSIACSSTFFCESKILLFKSSLMNLRGFYKYLLASLVIRLRSLHIT